MVILALLILGVSAKVTVLEPYNLVNDLPNAGQLPSTLANFGNPPYGSYILGRVHKYPHQFKTLGCSALDPVKFDDESGTFSHPILILDRGNCSFIVKARNAQTIGAQALIIVDNMEEEDVTKIVMVDDGTGQNIYIPTFMINKKEGDLIKKFIDDNPRSHVRMQLTFEVFNPDNRVEYEFWMLPEDKNLQAFLSVYSKHAKKLSKHTLFSPHFGNWYSVERQMEGFKTPHKDCLGAGRYCAYDPDSNGPRTGADIVYEELRQICINSQYQVNEKFKDVWWDYVAQLYKKCDFYDESCKKKILKDLGVDYKNIEDCIQGSVKDNGDVYMVENMLLDTERKFLKERGVFFYPSIIVNGIAYRGDLEPDEVLKMVCAGFNKQPEYCVEYFSQDEGGTVKKTIGVSAGTVLLIMFFAIVAFLAVLLVYRWWIRKDMKQKMRNEVNMAINQYIALSDVSLSKS